MYHIATILNTIFYLNHPILMNRKMWNYLPVHNLYLQTLIPLYLNVNKYYTNIYHDERQIMYC
jgi:hypothetical protein